MLTIYADQSSASTVQQLIRTEGNLSEHIEVLENDEMGEPSVALHFSVFANHLIWSPDWYNEHVPVYFESLEFNAQNFYVLVYTKLGHYDLALNQAQDKPLMGVIELAIALMQGMPISDEILSQLSSYNQALYHQFSPFGQKSEIVLELYNLAIEQFGSIDWKALALKHKAAFLSDTGANQTALQLIESLLSADGSLPESARVSLKNDWITYSINGLSQLSDAEGLRKIKESIEYCLSFYERVGRELPLAMLLMERASIENVEGELFAALRSIDRAVEIFKLQEAYEFQASALLEKADMLYAWAQQGNIQWYKKALESYNNALKYYPKEEYPEVFADIHHHLAVIYAEMPVVGKQRAVWAAFSATSFKEAMAFYTKQQYPYEYAIIANNYANALMNYPESKNSDNYQKAVYYLTEALDLRKARDYPEERAHTILNYLEACWCVSNVNEHMERVRYTDMVKKAKEIEQLTDDPFLLEKAQEHLKYLKDLKKTLIAG